MRTIQSAFAALTALFLLAPACAAPTGGSGTSADDPQDLGLVGDPAKTDGATRVREVEIDLAPGEMRWFRVRAIRYHAELTQDGDVPARLSTQHYDIEIEGETSANPEIEGVADEEMLRHWTLRVHNEGDAPLVGLLRIEA
ncbi:MAG: hypothetical protein ACOCUS_02605, partial [Polyangiales bacterium]